MTPEYDVVLRPMREDDVSFIRDTFAESYKDAPAARHIHGPIYKSGARRRVSLLAARGLALVAVPASHEDVMLGWVIVEKATHGGVIHYVYVKKAYRRARVATFLVQSALALLGVDVETADLRMSHWRMPAGTIAARHGVRFDPFAVLEAQ